MIEDEACVASILDVADDHQYEHIEE